MASATSPVPSSTSTNLVDLASMTNYVLNQTVVRQIVAKGDPNDAYAIGAVSRAAPSGNEYAQVVRLATGSPELQAIQTVLERLLAEMQNLIIVQGGLPSTPQSIAGGWPQTSPSLGL